MAIELTVERQLFSYDEPLLIRAVDQTSRTFLGVNYADTDTPAYMFAFARIKTDIWEAFADQRVDLRYAMTDGKLGRYLSGSTTGLPGEKVSPKLFNGSPSEFLPDTGFFLSLPDASEIRRKKQETQEKVATKLDGRWELDDLRKFSTLTGDAYAFTYALHADDESDRKGLQTLFAKYPWRGGFSTVNFINDLHDFMPAAHDIGIASIKYNSPGFIETSVDQSIAQSLRTIVEDTNLASEGESTNTIYEVYRNIYGQLKEKHWTARASMDLRLTVVDERELRKYLGELCKAIGLEGREKHIVNLGRNDMLAAVKIVLEYYRRIFWIAKYLRTGKVQQLFAYTVPTDEDEA